MLIGYGLGKILPGVGKDKVPWVIAGAVLPDFPLICVAALCWLIALLCGEYYSFVNLVDHFYFKNDVIIAFHHVLHAPLSLLMLTVFCLFYGKGPQGLWFLAGAASHSLVDVFTHAQDGILIFWPFNWTYRFNSGVDQWDMDGAGYLLIIMESLSLIVFAVLKTWLTVKPYRHFFKI